MTALRLRFAPAWTASSTGMALPMRSMDEMVRRGVYWVPTLTVDRNLAATYKNEFWDKTFELQRANFGKAMRKGVKVAFGTDAGGFDWKKIKPRSSNITSSTA